MPGPRVAQVPPRRVIHREVPTARAGINTHWRLCGLAHATVHHPVGKGSYLDEQQLFNARTEQVIALPHWEWAEDGGPYAGRVEGEGPGRSGLPFDFNPMTIEKLPASY